MTHKCSAYAIAGVILLAVFLLAGGSSLWTAAPLQGRMPSVKPLDQAIKQSCGKLAASLASRGQFGIFKPVEDVPLLPQATPMDYSLRTYAEAVNALFSVAISEHTSKKGIPFALKCTEQQRKAVMAYYRELMASKEHGFIELDTISLFAEAPSDYLLHAAWSWQDGDRPGPAGLALLRLSVLSALGDKQQVASAEPALFTHPQIARRIALRRSALCVSGAGVVLVAVVFSMCRWRCRSRRDQILEAARLDLSEGRFVAAHRRIQTYLTYCHGDADAQQIRVSLPENPELAQRAVQERADLENTVQAIQHSGRFIDVTNTQSWQRKQELAKHDARLEKAMVLYVDMKTEWDRDRETKQLRVQYEREAHELVSQRRLASAQERLDELHARGAGGDGVKLLESTLRSAQEDADAKMTEARKQLKAGDPIVALRCAEEAHEADLEAQDTKQLVDRLRNSQHGLRFSPKTVGKPLLVLAQTAATFGRVEGDVLVDNAKISGRHLRISLADDKLVAQDLGSRNGTFYRGEKFNTLEVCDGDIVDLAGAYQVTLHVQRGEGTLPARMAPETLAATDAQPADRLAKVRGPISGIFLEAREGPDVLLIATELRVRFTAVGMRPDAAGDCCFGQIENFVTLRRPGRSPQVVLCDSEIEIGSVAYRIEAGADETENRISSLEVDRS